MNKRSKISLRGVSVIGGGLGLVIIMLYMGGFFQANKIGPGQVKGEPDESFRPNKTGQASVQTVSEFYEAVGTVRPRTETNIEAQITGRIVEIRVRPGDGVDKGEELVVLDSRELEARLEQSRQGLISAKARREQARQAVMGARAVYAEAESGYERVRTYFDAEAATSQDLEQAESAYLQGKARLTQAEDGLREGEAGVRQAEKIVEESEIALGYTRIVAPARGEVVERLAEPGDLAWPGKRLVVMQTRGALRLEALVREGLIDRVPPGISLEVVVNAVDETLHGIVEEVIPSADPLTRSFVVKVGLPTNEGLYPGMFGRLLIPVGEHEVVVVPRTAVRRIGQLEVVTVKGEGGWQQAFVKIGRKLTDDKVEILSGLKGGETIGLWEDADA